MALIYQTDVMSDLSFLLGESSVPTTGISDRQTFIQRALDRVYRAYDWPMNKVATTVPIVAGLATLPANVHQDSIFDARIVQSGIGDDTIFTRIDYSDQDTWPTGTNKYWLTGYEGAYIFNSSETATTGTLNLYFETTSPIINASVATPFPSSMCLARGALAYYRQAEDPQADLTQEEELFQLELDEVIAQYNRGRAQPRGISLQEAAGTYPGDITDVSSYRDN